MTETTPVTTGTDRLGVIRAQRMQLHEALLGLEKTLATPMIGREQSWRTEVASALQQLRDAFADHIAATEGPDGLYAAVTSSHERLVNPVRRLAAEHGGLGAAIDEVATRLASDEAPATVREVATTLLARFSRHRQRGADLVYEAYNVDIGGE